MTKQSGHDNSVGPVHGSSLVEVWIVVGTLAILVALILPRLAKTKHAAAGRWCGNNLKHIGLAYRIFATDNAGQFPMEVPVTNGGSREWLAEPTQLWRHFVTLSNELSTPKTLRCPNDPERQWASVFTPQAQFTNHIFEGNQFLSYFVGASARESQPSSILGGDRNLATNGLALGSGRHVLTAQTQPGFTEQIHTNRGNLLRGDGRVEWVSSRRLNDAFRAALKQSGLTTNLWITP